MSDVEIVEKLYRAMAERDFATLFDLVHPDCVITLDERLPWGGRHVGHDGGLHRGRGDELVDAERKGRRQRERRVVRAAPSLGALSACHCAKVENGVGVEGKG